MIKFNHIRSRIAFPFLTVFLAIQLVGLILLNYALDKHANHLAAEQIDVGERLFVSLLQHNTQSLKQATQSLASDPAFREAVTNNDAGSLQSALEAYRERIHAGIAYYVSSSEDLVISTVGPEKILLGQAAKDARQAVLRNQYGTLKFDIVEGKSYQLINVPVKTPDVVGWIVMGFAVDGRLADQIKQLTHLEVSFLQKTPQQQWQLVAGTASHQSSNLLLKTVSDVYRQQLSLHKVNLKGDTYHLKVRSLHETKDTVLLVVLQGSVAPFLKELNLLFTTAIVLTILGLVVFAALAWYVARQTTEPVAALVKSADDIAMGNYEKKIHIDSSDEISYLAKVLNSMREAILQRSLKTQRLALDDELTGLPNRIALMQKLQQVIRQHADTQGKLGVVVVNIHRFKSVNTLFGRAVGDDLLRQVGQVLQQQVLSEHDYVSRLDADEFAVVLQQADQTATTRYADRIHQACEQPVQAGGQTLDVKLAIGISLYPDHGDSEEALLVHAQKALHESRHKKAAWIVYNTALEIDQTETLALVSGLKTALQEDQFLLYIQPKVDVTTRKTVGGEALLRWVHPEKGMVLPDQFIPFAEQAGLSTEITHWMLSHACRALADYRSQGMPMTMSVNLSARDLNNMALPGQIADLLVTHTLDAASLRLDISENSLMQAPENAEVIIRKLAEMGLYIAIDGFGTGYSSLLHLQQLPVKELKIDRSFVMFMDKNAEDETIVKSVIDLGHNLGLNVVAIGIESEDVLIQLARLGCDEGQGYFIGKPMPEKDFSIWLERWEGQNEIVLDIGDDLPFTANPLDDTL